MNEVISFGPFDLSVGERRLRRDEAPIQLGSRALDILMTLIEHAGEIVSNKDLVASTWPDVTVDGGVLRVHIASLRKALGDGSGDARYVINVPGRGYSFVAPFSRSGGVEALSANDAPSYHARTLPARLKRIVGREETCRVISKQLKTHRFVNIVGPGGMGKTTVAISVAHAAIPDFDGAVTFVDLGSIFDPHLVANTVASTLGLGIQGSDPTASLIASLASRKLLLVLDNCEHLIETVAPLAERIFSETEVYILATSRETLRAEGEHVYRLEPLESPSENAGLTAADAMTFPAVQLFVERAAARGSPITLSDDDAPVVGAICQNLDGLALAIELAAGRVVAHGFRGTATLLDNRFKLEWQGRRTALPRHQTLTSMFDWSYCLLSEAERLVLRRLSIFVGAFDLNTAADIVVGPSGDIVQFEDILAGLVEKSLISPIIGDANVRYRLLETTRAYAFGKLSEADETDMVAERHALHYTDLLQRTEFSQSTFRERDDPFSIAEHLGNIRTALNWCFSDRGKPSRGIALAAAAAPFFVKTPLLNECVRWSTRAISALPDADRGSYIELVLQDAVARSSMFTAQGDASGHRAAFERSLALVATHGDDAFRLRLLANFNLFLIRTGEFQAALRIAHQAQAVARSLNDPTGTVISNWIQGITQHITGNQAAAQASCEAGFAQAAALPNINTGFFGFGHRIRALTALARARWISGFPDQALVITQQALTEAADERSMGGISLVYAPAVFMWCGDEQKAQELIERVINYATRFTLTALVGAGLGLKGEFLVNSGDAATGVALLRRALDISSEQKKLGQSHFTTALAAGLAALGQYEAALTAIDRAISLDTGNGNSFYFPEILRIKGDILAAMPQSDGLEAEAWLLRSLNQARSQADLSWELRTAMSLAKLMSEQGRLEQGRNVLADVYGRFSEGFATADLQKARRQMENMTGLKAESHAQRIGGVSSPLQLFAAYNAPKASNEP
jgi:predicted ATPase/DNA-binding winged helix-turn-helix (wHTH) protein